MEIASYDGVQWGLPQDAESRPFFFWKDTMRKIGYSDKDIDALPERVASGDYTLANVLEDAKKPLMPAPSKRVTAFIRASRTVPTMRSSTSLSVANCRIPRAGSSSSTARP